MSVPEFWLNGDGSYWISAEQHPDEREAGEALRDEASGYIDDGESLVGEGRSKSLLIDCPLDDCEGHTDPVTGRETDCPEFERDVWEFTGYETWGTSWPALEEALRKGRVAILHPDLVERSGEIHWAQDCECERCDTLALLRPENDAPSVPMFPEEALT